MTEQGGVIKCKSPADAKLAAMLGNMLTAAGFAIDGPLAVHLVKCIRSRGWGPTLDVVGAGCGGDETAETASAGSASSDETSRP